MNLFDTNQCVICSKHLKKSKSFNNTTLKCLNGCFSLKREYIRGHVNSIVFSVFDEKFLYKVDQNLLYKIYKISKVIAKIKYYKRKDRFLVEILSRR